MRFIRRFEESLLDLFERGGDRDSHVPPVPPLQE
jgi:hypothetical protein